MKFLPLILVSAVVVLYVRDVLRAVPKGRLGSYVRMPRLLTAVAMIGMGALSAATGSRSAFPEGTQLWHVTAFLFLAPILVTVAVGAFTAWIVSQFRSLPAPPPRSS